MYEQKNVSLSLEQENKDLQRGLTNAGMQIASLEEQVFTLNNTLRKMVETPATDKTTLDKAALPDASVPITLALENVRLHAKLEYVAETIARIEEVLIHLSDVLAQ